MHYTFWRLFIAFSVLQSINAGVKIEISRVKDPPKMPQNIESNQTVSIATESTTFSTSTVLSTEVTTTTTSTTTESNIIKLTSSNTTSSSTMSTPETTTLKPQNGSGPMKPTQMNVPNTTTKFLNNTNNLTTTVMPTDINPYLAEFTRRQMRRKLIPTDYYCPCDLKVNLN